MELNKQENFDISTLKSLLIKSFHKKLLKVKESKQSDNKKQKLVEELEKEFGIELDKLKIIEETEKSDKDIDIRIEDIYFMYSSRVKHYIKEMKLEKVLEMKTCFFLNFISSRYSSVRNSNTRICKVGFCFILTKETNPEKFRRNLEMGLIRINFENRFEFFNQLTRTFTGVDSFLFNWDASQFDDVFIETYKKCLNSTDCPASSPVEIFFSTACSFNMESEASMRFLMLYLSKYKRILGEDCFLECSDDCLDKILKKLENCLQKLGEQRRVFYSSYTHSYDSMLTNFLKGLMTSKKREINQEKFFKRILNIKKRGFELGEKIKSIKDFALIYLYDLDLSCFVDINKGFAKDLIIKILEAKSVEQILEILRFCIEFLFTEFSKGKKLNTSNSFIQTIYENSRRQTDYQTSGIDSFSQKAIINFYQTAYKNFSLLKTSSFGKSRNECLDLLTPLFSNLDIPLLIDFFRGESIQHYSCLKGKIPTFELIKLISYYNKKFTPNFNLTKEEFIKIEAFNIYQKINNDANQDIILEKDFLVFLDIFFYYNTDSQNNKLFNFYQELLEKHAEESKSNVFDFVKTFEDEDILKKLMESQTKKEIRLFNLAIKYSLKELEEFNVKGVGFPEGCVFYQVFINFLKSYDFRHYFIDKMFGLELMKKILKFYTDDCNAREFSPYFRDLFYNAFQKSSCIKNFDLNNKNMKELLDYYYGELSFKR